LGQIFRRTKYERVKRINEGIIYGAFENVYAHYRAKKIKRDFDRIKAREYFTPVEVRSVDYESKKD
jgi:hypothetical protein